MKKTILYVALMLLFVAASVFAIITKGKYVKPSYTVQASVPTAEYP
jgi:hypothetical protein